MPSTTFRTLRLAFCVAAGLCTNGVSARGIEPHVHGDSFEALTPSALVSEAVERSAAIRLAAPEHWYSTAIWPDTLAVLGFDDPYPAGSALATLQGGTLALDFGGTLDGESLGFAAWLQSDVPRWTCGHAPPPLDAALLSAATSASLTTLPDAVLPDACRSAPSPDTLIREAWLASEFARSAVASHWMSDEPPTSLAEVGLDDPLPIARARLQLDDGLLVATFVEPLGGETLAIAPWLQAGSLRWVCGHAPAPVDATLQSGDSSAARTSLPEAQLPAACRSNPPLAMQVQDVVYGAAPARVAVAEFWANGSMMPTTLAQMGVADPLPAGQARFALDDGVLVATFVGALDGQRLGLAPYALDNTVVWACGFGEPPTGAVALATSTASAQTTLAPSLLPAWCR